MTALYDLFYIDGAHKQARELPAPASNIAYAKVDDDYLIPAESAWLMSTSDEALSRIGMEVNKP